MLMLLLLLLEREMREEFSFEEEEDKFCTQIFKNFRPCMGKAFKKKREHAEERERELCVSFGRQFFF